MNPPLASLFGLDPEIFKDPPEEFLDTFVGPFLSEMSENPKLRKKFFIYVKKKLGPDYRKLLTAIILDESTNVRHPRLLRRFIARNF